MHSITTIMRALSLLPRLHISAAILAALMAGASDAANVVNSIALPSYTAPGYVIAADAVDGDSGSNRHLIDTRANVTIDTAGTYEIQWSLLAPDDTEMVTSTTPLGAITTVPDTRNWDGTLEPAAAAPLLPGTLYRLRARLVRTDTGPTVEDTRTGAPGRTYIHFTGLNDSNTERNVVTEITSVTIDETWLLETDASRTTIPVTIGYTLHRYDNWDEPTAATSASIDATVTGVLVKEDDSTEPPITTTDTDFSGIVAQHDESGTLSPYTAPAPATFSSTHKFYFDPVGILAPEDYHMDVEATHVEEPVGGTEKVGGVAASAATFLAHFTGQLNFGTITTHFSSMVGAPAGLPVIPPSGSTDAYLTIAPDGGSGTVDGISDHHYGDGTPINVILHADGTADFWPTYTSGMSVTYPSGPVYLVPDSTAARNGTFNGVPFSRYGTLTLDESGAHGFVKATLPTGVGWTNDRKTNVVGDVVEFGATDFTQTLDPLPAALTITPGPGNFYLCEETKPVFIEATSFIWDTALGEFRAGSASQAHSIRKPLLDFLAFYSGSYPDPAMAVKKSNDHLYNSVALAQNAKVRTGTSGGGELTALFTVTASSFQTHFPYDAAITWSGTSTITVQDDLIVPASSTLSTASPVGVSYYQHCQEAFEIGCGVRQSDSVTVTSTSGSIGFTSDGGLHASGSVMVSKLSWGAIPNGTMPSTQFAHEVEVKPPATGTAFTTGNFLMAGTFLRGDQNTLPANDAPGVLLLSGFDPASLTTAERPDTLAYANGLGDYAGINFRCSTGSNQGNSTLQGDPYGPYDLTARSKYYIRQSGVTGIHEAPDGTFPGMATIGGYQFTLTSYGFSFLSNEQEDSRTSGILDLPDPTDFTLAFTEMRLSCLGALESFQITGAGDVDSKEFDFWAALFTPYSAQFESTSDCDPGAGTTLVLGFSAHASHFADAIVGALGIDTFGEFVTPSEASALQPDADVPTRITLPSAMQLVGTQGETYEFFPIQGAYLNDHNGAPEGYWSLFGSLDVPFFRDMQAHLHVRCGSTIAGTADPELATVVYIMGGWPSNGWLESTLNPFETTPFDIDNVGHTDTLDAYRKLDDSTSDTETYLPRAQQDWLDLISFDYPLKWSNTAFNFTGLAPISKDLVVVSTEHELQFMDAENAEISFGVRYEGLPEINLTSLAFNAIDDATGVSSAFVTAAGDKVFGALENGIDEFASTLSDKAEDLLGAALDAATTDLLDALVGDLKTKIATGVYTDLELQAIISARIGPGSDLTDALNELSADVDAATSLLYDVDQRLAKIEQAIDALLSAVTINPETGVALPVEEVATGLLAKVDVGGGVYRRIIFEALASELVDVLSTLVDASDIEEELTALVQELDPTLDSVTAALTSVKTLITDVRDQLDGVTGLGEEIQDLLADPTIGVTAIATVNATVEAAAFDIVLSATTEDLARLDAIADEWREQIAQEIRDAFFATELVAEIQEAVKERLYDLQASFNQAVDTAFAALNQAIQEALSDVLAALDDTINDTIGDFGTKLGAGSLTGYAHINGDSLDELRIDGNFELNVPDPLTLNAYLQIKEMDSDGPGACSGKSGSSYAEITIGTEDMSLSWPGLSLGGDTRADMNVKFGIDGGVPVSMGGEFEMTSGTISFETFEIYELAASVMFGATENYIAAAIGLRFGSVAVAGGVFFGKSCDLDPLKLIDPLVAEVVPTTTITGIYCYGEATFPIFGGTCFFNISAKAGAGVFYFQEGPTYGGRMTLGVYGEGLCAVEIGAEVSLAGSKSGDTYNFAGNGRVYGQAGPCPLCLKASFQVDFTYTDSGGWKVKF